MNTQVIYRCSLAQVSKQSITPLSLLVGRTVDNDNKTNLKGTKKEKKTTVKCLYLLSESEQSNNVSVRQGKTIRIYHECEVGIEESVKITDWHHEACQVMTNSDPEGGIFLSHPHTNIGFFFLLTIKSRILY